ncbi:uncharacterized protein HD556DRAFT_1464283 [Suillus plorans]|uniref:Uncharacterized protein n=1 Tax=Suillus plorans TaxID=116603 RepID=A0A9P7IYX8_9AGAM|nr:uncharacterized protein HD556DRAFT_1464283 [Suillus plorans]KAG1797713.1 hypothetical protein HD556DRAFT_1464283 [Suillus plorans]
MPPKVQNTMMANRHGFSLALGFSSWIHSHRDTVPPQPAQSSRGKTNRWVHYTALGLWRDASQDQIKVFDTSSRFILVADTTPQKRDLKIQLLLKFSERLPRLMLCSTEIRLIRATAFCSYNGTVTSTGGELASSEPRPVDPTFWDPLKSGSSMFYRPPVGYWSTMNKLTRDRELKEREKAKFKLQAQVASSSPQKAMPFS